MELLHINHDKTRIIIFFCGFYTDPNCFIELDNKKADILFVYDYSFMDFEKLMDFDFSPYTEVDLIAYSYGVFAANISACYLPPIDKSVAISGTIYPIDDRYGIKPKVYELMLNSFDKSVVENFKEKMQTNSKGIIKDSKRTIESLKKELAAIKRYVEFTNIEEYIYFDKVILTKLDKIFPYSAQAAFYESHRNKIELESGHFPFYEFKDFDEILEP